MFLMVKANIHGRSPIASGELPILLTPAGAVETLLDYFLNLRRARSPSWMTAVTRAVRLLLEYHGSSSEHKNPKTVFLKFSESLRTGTFDCTTGLDNLDLCWAPRSLREVNTIIFHLDEFLAWLVNTRHSGESVHRTDYTHTADRALIKLARCHHGDSSPHSRPGIMHNFNPNHAPDDDGSGSIMSSSALRSYFPEEHFLELMARGFYAGGRYDYRGMLITLLLQGGGLRESEPFHLYCADVKTSDANSHSAEVLIHHPSHGASPTQVNEANTECNCTNRAEYLSRHFDLVPRTAFMNSRHAGWHDHNHHDSHCKLVLWSLPEYGQWFSQLWNLYLAQCTEIKRHHPFAFINLYREPKGEMYTLAQFNKSHAAACRRIGVTVEKKLGTTPCGHWRAYYRLLRQPSEKKSEMGQLIKQAALQTSINSVAVVDGNVFSTRI